MKIESPGDYMLSAALLAMQKDHPREFKADVGRDRYRFASNQKAQPLKEVDEKAPTPVVAPAPPPPPPKKRSHKSKSGLSTLAKSMSINELLWNQKYEEPAEFSGFGRPSSE